MGPETVYIHVYNEGKNNISSGLLKAALRRFFNLYNIFPKPLRRYMSQYLVCVSLGIHQRSSSPRCDPFMNCIPHNPCLFQSLFIVPSCSLLALWLVSVYKYPVCFRPRHGVVTYCHHTSQVCLSSLFLVLFIVVLCFEWLYGLWPLPGWL